MHGTTGKKLTVLTFSALLAAMFALGGCGSSQPASSASSSGGASSASSSASASSSGSASAEADAVDLVIGDETSDSVSVTLENETGAAITALAFQPSGAESEPDELMDAAQTWKAGETALVYFEPEGSGVYDVEVGVGADRYVLHGFDAELIANAAINLDDGVAFVTYEQFGNEVSTQAKETELREAQAAAEAEAAAAAEAEAAAIAEAEAAAAAEEVVYSYEEPVATSAPAQSDDQCIDGGVVLR